jgi:hypothetical protein
MQVIPLAAVPSQTLSVVLAGQSCRINVYAKTTGLYLDLYVNDALIIGGVICLNTVLIVRDRYLGFIGDLAFFDLQGSDDPTYDELGTCYILGYIEQSDLSP